jgi:hypothetical protein
VRHLTEPDIHEERFRSMPLRTIQEQPGMGQALILFVRSAGARRGLTATQTVLSNPRLWKRSAPRPDQLAADYELIGCGD